MASYIERRKFLATLGGAAAAWPSATRAQQPRPTTIGFLFTGTLQEANTVLPGFRKGLSEMGFVEGGNLAIEYRFADNQYDRLSVLAADLVQRRVAVIRTGGGDVAARAAKTATATIPIVFHIGSDPVEDGLVASFNRPGGNVTGVSFMNVGLTTKRLGVLHDLVPAAVRFAMLVNPGSSVALQTADAQAAVAALGRQIEVFAASTNDEIDMAFGRMVQWRAEALLIGSGPLFIGRGARQLATLAVRYTLPAIHFLRQFVELGGLMSYGTSLLDTERQAGIYVGRILKGEKPGDLPVILPTRFALVINLTTARVLGIEVPSGLLASADEVIE
jgi:putative ABC transport system substrate-binding protein